MEQKTPSSKCIRFYQSGSRSSLSGEGCRALSSLLYQASRFHAQAPAAAGVRQRLIGRCRYPPERSRSIWLAPNAGPVNLRRQAGGTVWS